MKGHGTCASPAFRAEQMTDEDLHHELMRAGLSLNTAASAVDVFRQVCQAIDKGRIEPRPGWVGR